MLLRFSRAAFAAWLAGVLALATSASAQPIGTFTWQLQPFCNVLTLSVTQTGSVYTLDGYDDQCGGERRASATGLAFQNPDGTIGLGIAIIASPGAAAINVRAVITFPGLSGTWLDSSLNVGTLAFSPGPAVGSPRPTPRPVFAGLSAGGGRITDLAAPSSAADAATKGYADSLVAGASLPPASRFIFQPDGGFAALSTFGTGTIPASGAGARLLWHPAKAALRAGRVFSSPFGSDWDDGNVGLESVAFGLSTRASGRASIAIGDTATASAHASTALGRSTTASGIASTALGNITAASGSASTAMGNNTTASGELSTAVGSNASTAGQAGAFVYGDASTSTLVTATAPNQFIVRAAGGVRFFTNSTHTSGVQLTAGASAWTTLSDANSKRQFRDLDGELVLAKLASIPIREWSYKAQDAAIRHVGPTAQDFYAAFGLGEDPLGISTIDADGIALRAIQALETRERQEKEARDAENASLRAEMAAVKRDNVALRAELAALKAAIAALNAREP